MAPDVEARSGTSVDLGDLVGVLLLTRVEERLDVVTHVRVTTFREGPRGRWDAPTRDRLAQSLLAGAPALVDGHRTDEVLAEQRWLAWFPRPFGPHHAVNVSGRAVDWVARRNPHARLVRSHLAARSWQSELLQAVGPVATTTWGQRRMTRWVARGSRVPDADVRWAVVVEATARERDLVRAWAWGLAPIATSATLAARRGAHDTGTEAMPPPDVPAESARSLLDDLAGAGALRWSVTGPDPR